MLNRNLFTWKKEFVLLCLCILIFGTVAILLGQDNNWDLRDYHFYNGYALIHFHLFIENIMPAMVQTYINPAFDTLNYLAIAIQNPPITKFLLGAFSGACCFMVYKIAVVLFADIATKQKMIYVLLAVIIGATGSVGIGLIGTTTNDTKMTLLILISLFFLIRSVVSKNPSSQRNYVILAGLLIGLDVGFKLPAVCYAVSLSISLLFSKKWNLRHLYHFLIFSVFIVVGFLLANGYWMYFLNLHFHNPLFPYYNNIFHSPYAPAITYKDTLYYPQHLFTLPFYLAAGASSSVSDAQLQDLRLAILYVTGIVFLIKFLYQKFSHNNSIIKVSSDGKSAWLLVTFWFIASYLIWFYSFTIYRYILPLELTTGILFTCLVRNFFKSEVTRIGILITLIVIFCFSTHYPTWGRIPSGEKFFSIEKIPTLPKNSTILFLAAPLAYTIPFFPPDTRFIGMPFYMSADEKITNQTFYHLKDPLFSLEFFNPNNPNESKTKKVLLQHGILKKNIKCHVINTNVGDTLRLCPLKYLKN